MFPRPTESFERRRQLLERLSTVVHTPMLAPLVAIVLLLGAVACGPTVDMTIGDAAVTAAVKTALLNNRDIDGTLVTVRTQAGVVHLEGVQPSVEAAAQVVSIVRSVNGVLDVQSSITVGASPPTDPPSLVRE